MRSIVSMYIFHIADCSQASDRSGRIMSAEESRDKWNREVMSRLQRLTDIGCDNQGYNYMVD